jgi:organic hydroperoxide reductase OsmC/OhrA
MKAFPHEYLVEASGGPEGSVVLSAESLPALASSPPVEFGGPGDEWSPESLFVAAIVDCFVLTFRALAQRANFPWSRLRCHARGKLDREYRAIRFSEVRITAYLDLPEGSRAEEACRLLEEAETRCPISGSLAFPVVVKTRIGGDGGERACP